MAEEPESPDMMPDERPQRRREYSGAGSTLGLAALIVLVVGTAIWWFELRDDNGPGRSSGEGLGVVALPAQLNPTNKSAAARPGRAAPNFRLATSDGGTRSLTDYRGQWVLVNFWASWCKPCRSETPALQAFAEDTGTVTRVVVLAVNQQESANAAQEFAGEFSVTYPILLDREGEVSSGYGVGQELPSAILVDPSGVVRWVRRGQLSDADFAQIRQQMGGT